MEGSENFMLNLFSSFSISDGLRTTQTEILKIFVFLYALSSVHAKKLKITDYEFDITPQLKRYVFTLLFFYCIIWFIRFAREFVAYSVTETQKLSAAMDAPPATSPSKRGIIDTMLKKAIDEQRFTAVEASAFVNNLVSSVDLLLVAALASLSLYFAWLG